MMNEIRKCAKCGEVALHATEKKMAIYNSEITYQCDHCAAEIKLVPSGSIGVQLTLAILASVLIGYFWFSGPNNTSGITSYLVFGLLVLIAVGLPLSELKKHYDNPKQNDDSNLGSRTPELNLSTSPLKRIFAFVENLGFLTGLIAPIILIAAILGVATLIGYVNFTFFGN